MPPPESPVPKVRRLPTVPAAPIPRPAASPRRPPPLRLRAGEIVEVRSREEILETLDATGAVEGLVFMPEMLAFCGKRFSVANRADKTCDTVKDSGLRRMLNTVHLVGTRCDGSAHDGCQATCQLYWNEAWLRRVTGDPDARAGTDASTPNGPAPELLYRATRRGTAEDGEVIYRCQNTDVREASAPLPGWRLTQYLRDIWTGNASLGQTIGSALWSAARFGFYHVPGYRLQIWLYRKLHRLFGAPPLLDLAGPLEKTPNGSLGLAPGDLVQVKSVPEIRATLNAGQRNRGLYFDIEMTPYCGTTHTVRRRVDRIINEKTGRMITIPGDCVILEGAVCTGRYHRNCPRAIYPYWREIWLRRITAPPQG